MRLLYGTSNPAKLQHMKDMLDGLGIEVIGLKEVGLSLDVEEKGNTPLENARIKAIAYYRAAGIPTFSCDSGLYIEGLEYHKQPGVHVRRINGIYLTDEETIQYYTNLISSLGKQSRAKYKNAICLVIDEKQIFEHDGDDIADNFIMTARVHEKRRKGFPLDSISLDIETEEYFMDIGAVSNNEKDITKGFREFFMKII